MRSPKKSNLVKDRPIKSHPNKGRSPTIGGIPVRNMTKPIVLEVSEQDCKVGNRKQQGSCAAAIAATRQIPNCLEARIHIGRVYLKVKEGKKLVWLRGKTPNSLRTEIATFDRGGAFAPGTYKINPLSPSELPTGKQQGYKPKFKKGRAGKERQLPKILHNVRSNGHSELSYK